MGWAAASFRFQLLVDQGMSQPESLFATTTVVVVDDFLTDASACGAGVARARVSAAAIAPIHLEVVRVCMVSSAVGC